MPTVFSKTEGDSMFRLLCQSSGLSIVLVSFLVIFSPVVSGQTKGDVYLGYAFVSSGLTVRSCCFSGAVSSASAGRASLNGWEASASVMFLPWLRGVGDVSGGYGTAAEGFSENVGYRKANAAANQYRNVYARGAARSDHQT